MRSIYERYIGCSLGLHRHCVDTKITLNNFTFAVRFGAVPGPVLGADKSGGPVRVHSKTRGTLETDREVVNEIIAQPQPVGWHARVTAVDYCEDKHRVKK